MTFSRTSRAENKWRSVVVTRQLGAAADVALAADQGIWEELVQDLRSELEMDGSGDAYVVADLGTRDEQACAKEAARRAGYAGPFHTLRVCTPGPEFERSADGAIRPRAPEVSVAWRRAFPAYAICVRAGGDCQEYTPHPGARDPETIAFVEELCEGEWSVGTTCPTDGVTAVCDRSQSSGGQVIDYYYGRQAEGLPCLGDVRSSSPSD